MFFICWSPKGGSGTSVVAAGLALRAGAAGPGALLIDLAGDQPALLAVAADARDGIADWAAAPDDVPVDAIAALEVPVADGVQLVPRGHAAVEGAAGERLAVALAVLEAGNRPVVVDAGTSPRPAPWLPAGATLVTVVRPCYLALRRLAAAGLPPGSPTVVVEEPGRALTVADIGAAIGCDVAVRLPWDPAVARAVDAGLLTSRSPRSLRRLGGLLPAGARP